MQIQGMITQILSEQSGVSKNGNSWRKQEYLLQTRDRYQKKVCFSMFGDAIDKYNLQVGSFYTISVDVESREYNGRWYTEIRAWNAQPLTEIATISPPQQEPQPQYKSVQGVVGASPLEGDDLPF